MRRLSEGALARRLASSEDELIRRVLAYARQQGYTRYTSTLEEAWRLSISGLTASLVEALSRSEEVAELEPEEAFQDDPISAFGVLEARRHRERGIPLEMFLGLFKYYRQAYVDLVLDAGLEQHRRWLDRAFDRIEIAFCAQWVRLTEETKLEELRAKNRAMTNEKNRLLTVVESLKTPALLLDEAGRITFQNEAASRLTGASEYYQTPVNPFQETLEPGGEAELAVDRLPWLAETLAAFRQGGTQDLTEEVSVGADDEARRHYVVQLARMRDISGKYPGTVILIADVTERHRLTERLERRNQELTEAVERIETLEGILPICAACKKIRDEAGRWVAVEVYVRDRTRADFSHGICPECGERLYGFADGELR